MNSMLQKRAGVKDRTIIGIDVSKKELVCWEKFAGNKAFSNDQEGWRKMLAWMKSMRDVAVGFESTGPYGKGFQKCLEKAGILVVQVNPMHTARLKELPDNNPSKNDQKDAMVIADLVERGNFHLPIRREGVFSRLYTWHCSLTRVTQELTRVQNRKTSVEDGMEMSTEEKQWLRKDLRFLRERKLLLREQLQAGLREVPYGEALTAIPCLGAVTTARILGETGDLRQYRSYRQAMALVGLNLAEWQSGTRKGKVRLTKRGRPQARRLLFLAALRMVRREGEYVERYKKLVERGKPKVAAIVACSRALLRRMMAVARRHGGKNGGEGSVASH